MEIFIKFLFEFLESFFSGFITIFVGLWDGIKQIFNFRSYLKIINEHGRDFSVFEWILAALALLLFVFLIAVVVYLFIFIIKKYIRFRKSLVEQESLLEEIATLNQDVERMIKERENLMAMKVSQLGLKPGDDPNLDLEEGEEGDVDTSSSRFSKLTRIDEEYAEYQIQKYDNTESLKELVHLFRHFAASQLGLYYSEEMIRIFFAALGSTKLVILQGISGTGKTSLAYAWGKFLKHDSCVASVQPSWRDRTELFGYFNEFTKKFNETDVLREIYVANYTDNIHTVILDEMNIARVEYYFAEMLSILEMPDRSEWIVELVPSSWPCDPKLVRGGKLKLPANIWYIGTINNDDSTFAVTDKVYDRAIPIDINDKGQVFEPDVVEAIDLNYTYLERLFEQAYVQFPVSEEGYRNVEILDDYVIKHFRVAFGNRIVMQMGKFVPAFVAAGGDEVAGIDYFLARKVLRKFEQLNVSFIRNEIDPMLDKLDEIFGKDKMVECKEYLSRLKKLS